MNDRITGLLAEGLDLAAARQQLLAHRLASIGANSPSSQLAAFKDLLESATRAGAEGVSSQNPPPSNPGLSDNFGAPEAEIAFSGKRTETGASSDLETTMASLSENVLRFATLSTLLSVRLKTMETAITGK